MKIALVTGGMPFGGTTTFCLYLASGLQTLGVAAEVLSFSNDHPMAPDFVAAGVTVYREDEQRLILEDRLTHLYEQIRDFAPDAVFAVLGSESFEMLRYLPEGVFRVGMLHDHLPAVYELARQYAGTYDHLAVVSASIAETVARDLPHIPRTYLQHGILLNERISPRDANLAEPLKLLFFGRFQESQKGVRIFPEIFAALKRKGVVFRWTLHGQGPESDFLQQNFADAVRAGEIVFSPPVEHDDLDGIIRRHDIYILTSNHEAGPLTLLEAMSHGLVPVCSDIPCLVQEVIDGTNGFRVPLGDAPAYAEVIAQLDRDRPSLEAMSEAARRTVTRQFSATAMAQRYIDFVHRHAQPRVVDWPESIAPLPMVGMEKSFAFTAAGRWLRRIRRRFTRP